MVKSFRDRISGFTHFIGIILSVIGTIALLTRNGETFTVYHATSFFIFGFSMTLLYTISTLYHWLPLSEKKLIIFRKIDHIMIFVFIAASYTPVCLITLRESWGWVIFGIVWGLTLAGFFLKLFWLKAPRFLYTSIYLLMGWIIIAAILPLSKVMPSQGLLWLALGGVFYSAGAVIYAIKKPDPLPNVFGFHEIFHLFIMAGSFSIFWMIYKFV
ncbi:MAG: hemolysin III family protein [Bacteroidetes bacterium]|nr:hemolysin III family protein [Bacteroidota bacterium]MCH8034213.1 hemolysin III family protein [Bacteroidota bacterium]